MNTETEVDDSQHGGEAHAEEPQQDDVHQRAANAEGGKSVERGDECAERLRAEQAQQELIVNDAADGHEHDDQKAQQERAVEQAGNGNAVGGEQGVERTGPPPVTEELEQPIAADEKDGNEDAEVGSQEAGEDRAESQQQINQDQRNADAEHDCLGAPAGVQDAERQPAAEQRQEWLVTDAGDRDAQGDGSGERAEQRTGAEQNTAQQEHAKEKDDIASAEHDAEDGAEDQCAAGQQAQQDPGVIDDAEDGHAYGDGGGEQGEERADCGPGSGGAVPEDDVIHHGLQGAAGCADGQPARRTPSTIKIRLDDIDVPPARRIDIRGLEGLEASIVEIGLLHPITVIKEGDRYGLSAGGRRLRACRGLGWTEIECKVLENSDDVHRLLAEIDENLIRRTLSAMEEGEMWEERRQIYEQLHPETKQHVAGGLARQGRAASDNMSFAGMIARKTGKSERYVQRMMRIGQLPASIREKVRDTPLANNKEQLTRLTTLSPAEQEKAVEDYRARKLSEAPKRPRTPQRDAEAVTPAFSNHPDQTHGKECAAAARVFTGPPSALDGAVEDGQADFVITAPPGAFHLDDVGSLAQRKLRDGGVCLVVVNQGFIPTANHHLSKFLDYRWEMVIGRFETPVTAMNISSDWSPVLVYVKLPFSAPPWTEPTPDCFYNQGPRALTDLITALVPPNATVLNPLAGEGDVAVACVQAGRMCLAAEEDDQKAARARERCGEVNTPEGDAPAVQQDRGADADTSEKAVAAELEAASAPISEACAEASTAPVTEVGGTSEEGRAETDQPAAPEGVEHGGPNDNHLPGANHKAEI